MKSLKGPITEQEDKMLHCRVVGQVRGQVPGKIQVQKLGLGSLAFKKELHYFRRSMLLKLTIWVEKPGIGTAYTKGYSHVRKKELLVIL